MCIGAYVLDFVLRVGGDHLPGHHEGRLAVPGERQEAARSRRQRRCPQHSVEPSVRQAIQLSRVRAGLVSTGQRPADVKYDRFETAEALDELFDEGLSVLRADLRLRRADKARTTSAIAQLAEAKLKLKSLKYTARALARLKPGALTQAASSAAPRLISSPLRCPRRSSSRASRSASSPASGSARSR